MSSNCLLERIHSCTGYIRNVSRLGIKVIASSYSGLTANVCCSGLLQLHSQSVLPATLQTFSYIYKFVPPALFLQFVQNFSTFLSVMWWYIQADSGMLATSNIRGVMLYIICISNLTRMWNCPDFWVTKYVGCKNV